MGTIYYDIELFRKIKIEIRSHAEKYREAGKWLDEYCSVENFWKRQEEYLEYLQESGSPPPDIYVYPDGDGNTADREKIIYEKAVEYLELMIKLKKGYFRLKWLIDNWIKYYKIYTKEWLKTNLSAMGNVPEKSRLDNAYDFLTADPARSLFIGLEKARRVILITWLLYDPDSENSGLNLTGFEGWPWSSRLPSTQKFLANYRNERTYAVEDNRWMVLVRTAWDEIQAAKSIQTIPKGNKGKGKRRQRNTKLTNKQKEVWEKIHTEKKTQEQAAYELGCSVPNICQRLKEAEDKLRVLNAGSRSINFSETQRIPTDKRGQEIISDED